MLCSLYSTFLITSGLRENSLLAGVLLQLFIYCIPVPKPGKDTSNPSNYRPIALTSCIWKVMERMISSRLVWYLERNRLTCISPMQCGFRKQRSTTDHLVRLESFVREAFAVSLSDNMPSGSRYVMFTWRNCFRYGNSKLCFIKYSIWFLFCPEFYGTKTNFVTTLT